MWVLIATLSIFMLIGCFKLITNTKWSKESQLLPLPKQEDDAKEKHDSKWSTLPNDISELILKRLSREDFYRFSEVCTSWRRVVAKSISDRTSSPLPSMPLLLLHRQDIENDMTAGLFSLKDQKVYHPKTPLFEGNQYCVGSIEGWLIMVGHNVWIRQPQHVFLAFDSQVFFWNPVSDAVVMLPSKLSTPRSSHRHKLLRKAVASSRPDSPNCLVACLFFDRLYIAFCKLDDGYWSVIPTRDMNLVFVDIELVHGKCYVLTETARLGKLHSVLVYDLHASPPQAKILIRLRPQMQYSPYYCLWTLVDRRYFHIMDYVFCYLASDPAFGDLYLIFVIADIVVDFHHCEDWSRFEKFIEPPIEKEFIVYKVDISGEHPRLVKVQSLNDGMLFLSNKGGKIVPSSSLDGPKSLIKGDSIFSVHAYSCEEHPPLGSQIAIFSMDDRKVKYIPLPTWEPGGVPVCLWFTPTLW